jgi:hypothetical protein
VQRLIKSGALQAKLRIGQPTDIYEQEADRVADQVMRMTESRVQRQPEEEKEPIQSKPLAEQITPLVQRQSWPEEEEEEEPIQAKLTYGTQIQRQGEESEEEGTVQTKQASRQTSHVSPNLEAQIHSMKGGGQPLSPSMRSFFEPRFGQDFSQVRIHTDITATESAQAINARAYTLGKHIVFGVGQYAPETLEGRKLLSHELVHSIQQTDHLLRHYVQRNNQPDYAAILLLTRWENLPKEARRVLQYSFKTRQQGEWIWKRGKSAADCFNRLRRERRQAFRAVYDALKAEGVWTKIQRVIDFWPRPVRGVRFTLSNPKRLMSHLILSHRFCRDTHLGGSQHKGVTWRQVVKAGTEGLHIEITSKSSNAHLDTISPVLGRAPNGECRYSMRHILPHISRELWGWRNIELFPPVKPRKGKIQPWVRIYIPGT